MIPPRTNAVLQASAVMIDQIRRVWRKIASIFSTPPGLHTSFVSMPHHLDNTNGMRTKD
jgi:hypothetical protein